MILMIDNYCSFTYNIVQYFGELQQDIVVKRNDEVTLDEIRGLAPKAIILGPGPCTPTEAGVTVPILTEFGGQIPILGVCLGHQAIGQAFGGDVVRAGEVMHGRLQTCIIIMGAYLKICQTLSRWCGIIRWSLIKILCLTA